jgi:hypothetical protein
MSTIGRVPEAFSCASRCAAELDVATVARPRRHDLGVNASSQQREVADDVADLVAQKLVIETQLARPDQPRLRQDHRVLERHAQREAARAQCVSASRMKPKVRAEAMAAPKSSPDHREGSELRSDERVRELDRRRYAQPLARHRGVARAGRPVAVTGAVTRSTSAAAVWATTPQSRSAS